MNGPAPCLGLLGWLIGHRLRARYTKHDSGEFPAYEICERCGLVFDPTDDDGDDGDDSFEGLPVPEGDELRTV